MSSFFGLDVKRKLEIAMRKIAEYLVWVLLILLMTMAVLTFLAPRLGWSVATVLSGSMEPRIRIGSVVISRPTEAEKIEQGDIITFYSPLNNQLTTHRVVGMGHSSQFHFQTAGDSNEDHDQVVVPFSNVVGKVILHIPYLGYATQFIKTPLGLLLTLYLPGLAIMIMEMRNILRMLRSKPSSRSDLPMPRGH